MKHKSQLKDISLGHLILVPQVVGTALTPIPVFAVNFKNNIEDIHQDISRFKHKAIKVMDINIKRLEKVRKRIVDSSKESATHVINKIDEALHWLKGEKPKMHSLDSVQALHEMNLSIKEKISEYDVTLGQVFDGRRDSKQEKVYYKLENKLDDIQSQLSRVNHSQKDKVLKNIQRARNIIEQLRNEDKNGKDKIETKQLRRDLNESLNFIQKVVR